VEPQRTAAVDDQPGRAVAGRVGLVVHPQTVDVRDLHDRLTEAASRQGSVVLPAVETSVEDAGSGATRTLLDAGCDLVLVAGGDGTVRAAASALVHTGIPLGILPTGPGNLLVRNLGIPISVDDAIAVALTGRDRLLDCGRVGGSRFVVMAGIGLDAAMVRDAPARTKKALGWPAYVLSGARHVNDPAMRVRFRLDDGPWQSRRARMLVAGNVGELQGGLALFPDADPGDGVLELAVLCARSPLDWLRVASAVVLRRPGSARGLERHRFRRLEVRTERQEPFELDGDHDGTTSSFVVVVEPAALLVRIP
jgi:diacylglycerol kinase family enzyme